jgi:hypothetical protein
LADLTLPADVTCDLDPETPIAAGLAPRTSDEGEAVEGAAAEGGAAAAEGEGGEAAAEGGEAAAEESAGE